MCARTRAHCLHVYNKVKCQEKYDKYRKSVKILLISKLFLGNIWRFRKMFVLLHSLLRNTISQALKKVSASRIQWNLFQLLRRSLTCEERVLWKILYKQTSSTRSGFGLHLIIYREYEGKETNRQAIDKSGLLSFNKRKGYSS